MSDLDTAFDHIYDLGLEIKHARTIDPLTKSIAQGLLKALGNYLKRADMVCQVCGQYPGSLDIRENQVICRQCKPQTEEEIKRWHL